MGLFKRVSDNIRANLNSLLDKAEDPEKMLDQYLRDMEKDIADAESAVAKQLAVAWKFKAQLDEAMAMVEKRETQALEALKKDREDLARKALEDKKANKDMAEEFRLQYENSSSMAEQLKAELKDMKDEYGKLRNKRDTLIARVQAAKAQKDVYGVMGGLGNDNSRRRIHIITLPKLDVTTPEVYTEQGVPVMADGVAIIKIGGSVEDVATAAEQFLSKPAVALSQEAQEVLEGHLRAILGTMTVEEVYRNRDKFAQEVQGSAAKDLRKMGLQIVSFTIKDIRDKNGYLEALGKPRIAAVKRDAEVAEAEAVRDARIQKAKAAEEGEKAELLRDTSIAEATKEKQLKVASFKKEQDTAMAEADQAYHIQEARSQQQLG